MKYLLVVSALLVALHLVLVRTNQIDQKLASNIREDSVASTPTDILTPYLDYPRFERATTNTTKENFTHFYETHDPNVLEWAHIQTLQFIDATTEPGRSALGTITFVNQPRTTFSVLEPFSPGSCNNFWPGRATVEVTASRRSGGCLVAQNAGYFRMGTSACLGNIVSDGRFVRESDHVVNANFGIKASGKIFVGYLSNEEVKNKTDPFLQLLSGVIWLVKNGSNFVNESMRIESDHNEETGNLTEFVNVVSARTAVGHDKLGRVMMAVVDGQTRKRGVNLFELADIMIRQGAVNAINLDGGGSATLVREGVLANHVSDHCAGGPEYRCMRQVSTVVCAHGESCVPQDCHKRGECVGGECQCRGPWTGLGCNELLCANGTCGEHGSCEIGGTASGCECEDGWIGELCENTCPSHFYGPNCNKMCWCYAHGVCHPETGACLCRPGYRGVKCEYLCLEGTYGDRCEKECECSENQFCHHVTGCECSDGKECNISINPVNSSYTNLPPADTTSSIPSTTVPANEQTTSTTTSVNEQTAPTTTSANEQTVPTTASANEQTAPTTDSANEQTAPTTASANEQTAPTTASANEQTAPTTASANEQTVPTTTQLATNAAATDRTESNLTYTTDEYAPISPNGLEHLTGWNISSDCTRSMLISYPPLALCSCLSNVLICLGSWFYWGGYKRRMLKRRGNYTHGRHTRLRDNFIGGKPKQKEGNILQKIMKPLPPSYELVSTQLANESSDSNSS